MIPISMPPTPVEIARILVVDDQPANLQVIGAALGKLGYEIVPATDGPTALKRVALRLPDLILLDVLMPDMDGFEVCRQIRDRQEWKEIPIIFLSAADDKDLIVRALDAGGVDYITKPFNHAELISRVRTHLALKAARDRSSRLAEDKDQLLGILAHDLKNHLGGMQMSANILHQRMAKVGDEKLAQLCDNILHSTGRLLGFAKEFLANSAAEHGLALKMEAVDLSDAISHAVQDYREAAGRKNLDIRATIPIEGALVVADRGALRQILDNLLSNAVKFSPPGKQIEILVRAAGNFMECVIRDQGPGFTSEDQTRMFRRYGRLSARPTGGEPSTGLGLSIAKKLVQDLNGELICDSSSGLGATFVVRLQKPEAPRVTPFSKTAQ
jgi:two-component system sensor histidine kinase/response regulator